MTDRKAVTLPLPVNEITERHSEHLSLGGSRESRARAIARPLFEAGVTILCLAKMPAYGMAAPGLANNHRISLVIQGQMTFLVDDERFTVGPGDLVVTPAGSITQRRAHGKVEWIYIDIHDLPLWAPLKKRGGYTRAYESADHMYILIRRILDAHLDRDAFSIRCALENCQMLLTLLKRELSVPEQKAATRIQMLAGLCDRIRKDPGGDWSRPTMAKALCVAERQLNRIFLKTYGHSPLQMVIQIRMHRAAELLVDTDQSIEAIARAIGYKSAFALSRVFTKNVGLSPSAYRQKHR